MFKVFLILFKVFCYIRRFFVIFEWIVCDIDSFIVSDIFLFLEESKFWVVIV